MLSAAGAGTGAAGGRGWSAGAACVRSGSGRRGVSAAQRRRRRPALLAATARRGAPSFARAACHGAHVTPQIPLPAGRLAGARLAGRGTGTGARRLVGHHLDAAGAARHLGGGACGTELLLVEDALGK